MKKKVLGHPLPPTFAEAWPRDAVAYFAYGSNMDEAQMQRRIPGSRLLCRAHLPGHEFIFSGYSQTWGGAVGNIRRRAGKKVFGVVYVLPPGGLSRLSRFEGPRYQLKRALVSVLPPGRGKLSTVTYYQRETKPLAPPSPAYTAVILNALRKHRAP